MTQVANRIREITGSTLNRLPIDELLSSGQPAVLKGVAAGWGLVQAGLCSVADAMRYLRSFYNGKPVQYSFGEPDIEGRPFYTEDFAELNCVVRRERLDEVLTQIELHLNDARPPTYYVASLLVDSVLPGFQADNSFDLSMHGIDTPATIWIGNRTIASCHYDAPNNIACCAVGRRRFTLFPPEQICNLYPGPLKPTPGGQAVSVVDFDDPDLESHPRFREALSAGQWAEVEPGDAVFIPSMWWHHVEGLSAFNTLINYWWSSTPAFIPTPMHALYHAIWTIRDRPEREKQAWKQVFDYYVFGPGALATDHLPPAARGILAPIDDTRARQIRAMLIAKLNR
jgi:Cupin-like domain